MATFILWGLAGKYGFIFSKDVFKLGGLKCKVCRHAYSGSGMTFHLVFALFEIIACLLILRLAVAAYRSLVNAQVCSYWGTYKEGSLQGS